MCMTTGGVKGAHFTGFICTVLRSNISYRINHRSFYEIPRKRGNSVAWVHSADLLEFLWLVENCGP